MMKIHQVQRIVTEIDGYVCNRCGGTCCPEGSGEAYGLRGYFSAGYNSRKEFEDGKDYSFDLCEKCLVWLFSKFKIKPTES